MRTRKNFWTSLSLVLLSVTGFCGCSSVDDGSYVEPIRLYEKIDGKWVINSLTQTDESNGKIMALTSMLDFDSFVIHLNRNSNGEPADFTVEGSAPELLPVKGTWTLDHPFTKSDGTAARLTLNGEEDAPTLTITTMPGNNQTLEFRLTRQVNGKPFVSYTYNLMQAVE